MPCGETAAHPTMFQNEALVVFEHRASTFPWRLLRPGFRHCLCLVRDGAVWNLCDPLKTRIVLKAVEGLSEAELHWVLSARGAIVLRGLVSPDTRDRSTRLRAMTCVEVVKRVLNVDLPWAITPYQLYRGLQHLAVPFVRLERPARSNSELDVAEE